MSTIPRQLKNKKLRLLATRFQGDLYIDVIRQLRDREYKIVYWERSKGEFGSTKIDSREFPETIFHSGLDARMAIPAPGVDTSQFEPLSKEFIHEMHECESQVLTMMNVEDLLERVPVIKRKHIYYEYLKYWRGVLTTLHIDAVISTDIPHVSFQYVMYCVARKLNIPFIMRRMTKMGPQYVMIDRIDDYTALREEYEWLKNEKHTAEELHDGVRVPYQKIIDKKKDAVPFYIKKDFMRRGDFRPHDIPTLGGIRRSLQERTFFNLAFLYVKNFFKHYFSKYHRGDLEGFDERGWKFRWHDIKWERMKRRYKKQYEVLQKAPDFKKKYIYFPLHNQPEASTSAMGGIFVNQFLAIDMLSASLPEGWGLYVKENPGQWVMQRTHVGRFPGFYEDVAALKNVRLVPHETSTFELIESAHAVASVTSFACWEGLLRGKPAVIFGYPWFMHCDGVLRVGNFNECKSAIEKIKGGFKPDTQRVLNYLIALQRVSFASFHTPRARLGLGLKMTDRENTKVLVEEFERELENIRTEEHML